MIEYNFYCDESCHLENDDSNVMVLGAVWCPKEKRHEINERIKQIKKRNGVPERAELKWTKIAPAKMQVYFDLVQYFFDEKDLHFRGLLIPEKNQLDHKAYNQTHDDWYYKMYFGMLKAMLVPTDRYNIFIDIKDTHSSERAEKLRQVISNSMYDFSKNIVKQVKPIRSEEVQIMQITDVLIGAFGYNNRNFTDGKTRSTAKRTIIELIQKRSGYTLQKSTLLREDKLNLFVWRSSNA
ncbi:MAG: DUF3800 domain-containing protein [Fibrobacter sp.]|nr:DUF3800 domain-containing protein [Fibrobacter sp.]